MTNLKRRVSCTCERWTRCHLIYSELWNGTCTNPYFVFNPPNSRSETIFVTHLDILGQNTKIISEKAFSSSVLNRDPFVFRGSAVSRVWTASPVEKPPAGLPLLPALLHPAHPRAARRAPQEPRHLLISIKYAQVGALVGVAQTGR